MNEYGALLQCRILRWTFSDSRDNIPFESKAGMPSNAISVSSPARACCSVVRESDAPKATMRTYRLARLKRK